MKISFNPCVIKNEEYDKWTYCRHASRRQVRECKARAAQRRAGRQLTVTPDNLRYRTDYASARGELCPINPDPEIKHKIADIS